MIAPVANFTADNTTVCVNENIQFNDTSLGNPTEWLWGFGDEQTSTDQNATHAYILSGLFTVALNATNGAGSDTMTKTDYITVNDCNNDASITANATCHIGLPLPVQFGGSCDGTIVKTYWDFGDGNNSEEQNPEHTYEYYGVFTVNHSCNRGGSISYDETYISVGVPGTNCPGDTGCQVSGGAGDYHPAYVFPSTEVVTVGFLGVCGMLVLGLIGRKE
jgi:PKD repeat protein